MFLLLLLWPPSGESCRPFRLRRLKELERVEGLERLERWHEAKPERRILRAGFLRLPPKQVVLVGLGWGQLSVPSVTVILVTLVTKVTWLLLPWKPDVLSPVLLRRWRPPVLVSSVAWVAVHIHWFPCVNTIICKILMPLVTSVLANMSLLLPLVYSCWSSHTLLCESACHLLHQRLCMVYRHPVPIV